jgi:hypothetical protein
MGNSRWLIARLSVFAKLEPEDPRVGDYYDAQPCALYSFLSTLANKQDLDGAFRDFIVVDFTAAAFLRRHRGFFNHDTKHSVELSTLPLQSISHRIWSTFSVSAAPVFRWFIRLLGFRKRLPSSPISSP